MLICNYIYNIYNVYYVGSLMLVVTLVLFVLEIRPLVDVVFLDKGACLS